MTNPFDGLEPFKPSLSTLLTAGNHVVTIDDATPGRSSGGYPQVELNLSNEYGAIRDWVVQSPNEFSLRKVVGLTVAAGLGRPTEADLDDGHLSDAYVRRLIGRKVGIVVHDEEYNGQTRPKVQGYVDASEVGSDVTQPGAANGFSHTASPEPADLPF